MTFVEPSSQHDHALSLDAALEFLNTLELESGVLVDRLERPADAGGWFEEHGALHAGDAVDWRESDLVQVRATRDALRAVLDAVVEDRVPEIGAVQKVNAALGPVPAPRLVVDGDTVRVSHGHHASSVEAAIAALASPIVDELGEGRPDRFRNCANDRCHWSFYDSSPTGRRRWCDMKTCGNRAKAARHRERIRFETETTG